VAAWTVGLLILFGTGWSGGAVLAAFFVSSNLVSRVAPAPQQTDAKGERRDAWQVYANGGPAAFLALSASSDIELRFWLMTASLAAAAADTWATSIGARSRVSPRLLWSGQPVPPGTSGGVTATGNLAGIAGAAIVAGTAAFFARDAALFAAGTLIGFLGMLIDSLIGGRLQGRFWCVRCDQPSEWRVHRCGSRTAWKAGVVWLNNDGVNLIATAVAGALALAVWRCLD
jgi:uncharacterized protein (TIGR00297 family)